MVYNIFSHPKAKFIPVPLIVIFSASHIFPHRDEAALTLKGIFFKQEKGVIVLFQINTCSVKFCNY